MLGSHSSGLNNSSECSPRVQSISTAWTIFGLPPWMSGSPCCTGPSIGVETLLALCSLFVARNSQRAKIVSEAKAVFDWAEDYFRRIAFSDERGGLSGSTRVDPRGLLPSVGTRGESL